jgi:2-methylcitrate dehydratase PrpD
LPASDAARVNAVMSDAAASDDSDLRNIVRAGTTLVASALAIAERTGAGGEEVLTAMAVAPSVGGQLQADIQGRRRREI